ncbi:MAG: twin-arginine translocation signal domain-containing protein, partial [bacterium]
MQQRREFVKRLAALGAVAPVGGLTVANAETFTRRFAARETAPSPESRDEWLRILVRIADPVLSALAGGTLRKT